LVSSLAAHMRRSWSGSPFCRFRFSFCRENSFSRHSHVSAAGLSQARLSFASWSQFWARAPVRSPRSATRIFPLGVLSARKITPNLFSFPILFGTMVFGLFSSRRWVSHAWVFLLGLVCLHAALVSDFFLQSSSRFVLCILQRRAAEL
jgi:hypothetical protein